MRMAADHPQVRCVPVFAKREGAYLPEIDRETSEKEQSLRDFECVQAGDSPE